MTSVQPPQWNGSCGSNWAAVQDVVDRMFLAVEKALVEVALAARPASLLDIGCGAGGTTLAMAQALGSASACTGVDISEALVQAAAVRAREAGIAASFVRADAATHPFPAGSFDLLVSRFGVMFFSDPVAGFAHLRGAARPGALLHAYAWRAPAENAFMTAAERGTAHLLPAMPPRDPQAPGQFAFADASRVETILRQAGWEEVALEPEDFPCAIPQADLERYFTHLGPVALALAELADREQRAAVVAAAHEAFAPWVHEGEVRFNAACWRITARASSRA